MKTLSDNRKLTIKMINTIDGELRPTFAAEARQEEDGSVVLSGLWADLLPFSNEDHALVALSMGVSPLEWLRRRLSTCAYIVVEVVD
jgi:hypothetical protein